MYYGAKTILQMSDEEFWRCTPRKLSVLFKVHEQIQTEASAPSSSKKPKEVFIDQIF